MMDSRNPSGSAVVEKTGWHPSAWMFYAATAVACVLALVAISAMLAEGRTADALAVARADADKRLKDASAKSERGRGFGALPKRLRARSNRS